MRNEDIRLFYDSNSSITIIDEYEMFIQEVDILFETNSNEVLNSGGDKKWIDLQKLVFETGISTTTLKNEINNLIKTECPSNTEIFKYTIDVKFIRGNESDIGIIDLVIYDNRNIVVRDKKYFIG